MKKLVLLYLVFLSIVCSQQSFPQTEQPEHSSGNTLYFQPIIWLDNLVPTQLIGFAAHYERRLTNATSFNGRVGWFRHPLFGHLSWSFNGYVVTFEYRHYFSGTVEGWHIGPFAEWVGFEYLGNYRKVYGNGMRSVFDFGAVGGHKWITKSFVFDLSARAAWYSPAIYPKGRYFPSRGSNYNSQFLLSIGYVLD